MFDEQTFGAFSEPLSGVVSVVENLDFRRENNGNDNRVRSQLFIFYSFFYPTKVTNTVSLVRNITSKIFNSTLLFLQVLIFFKPRESHECELCVIIS